MANENKIMRYLSGTATQGSADAYVELGIATGIVPADGLALQIERIDICGKDTDTAWQVGAAQRLMMAVSRDTKTAMPEFSDPDVLWKYVIEFGISTSGAFTHHRSMSITPPSGLFVVEPTIYFQLDSTSFGQALDFDVRLYYTEVKLSEIEILRLLNNV